MEKQTMTDIDKQLINMVASMVTGCESCSEYHFNRAIEMNIEKSTIETSLDFAIKVWKNAQEQQVEKAYSLSGIDQHLQKSPKPNPDNKHKELIRIAVMAASNNASNLKVYIESAKKNGATDKEISMTIRIVRNIQQKAIEFSDKASSQTAADHPFEGCNMSKMKKCC